MKIRQSTYKNYAYLLTLALLGLLPGCFGLFEKTEDVASESVQSEPAMVEEQTSNGSTSMAGD